MNHYLTSQEPLWILPLRRQKGQIMLGGGRFLDPLQNRSFQRERKHWAFTPTLSRSVAVLFLLGMLPATFGRSPSQYLGEVASGGVGTATAAMVLNGIASTSTLDIPVASGTDDVEERTNGTVITGQPALDMAVVNGVRQTVGLRFTGIGVQPGATVTNAYVQFQTRVSTSGTINLTVRGEASDNADPFTAAPFNVSSRVLTTASARWSPPSWLQVGEASVKQRTSDISSVLQEIFNRPEWSSGNALSLIITGSGRRIAEAFEGARAPVLHIESSSTPDPQCSDGMDNDGDGLTDFPNDPGCTSLQDNDETDTHVAGPNILVIMTDDQRASSDGLSVMEDLWRIYGDGGTYYPNAVASTPLCCPSRASTFSGRYAHNTGVIGNNGDPLDQTTTLQYHLQNLGYKTALTGRYLNDFTGTPPHFDLLAIRAGYYDSTGTYGTTYIKDKAIEFLREFERNDAQPWLMYVTPFAPHPDAIPENKYRTAYVPPWEDNPARTEVDLGDKPPSVQRDAATTSKTKIQSLRKRMIQTLYSVDDLIGDVFAELDALGEKDTLAFFLSDHGYHWYEHRLSGKGTPYDDAIQVPFFVKWPGRIPTGRVDYKIVSNIDIAPTVYDAIDYAPGNFQPDGRSIFNSNRNFILTEGFGRGFKSLWAPNWMYAEYTDGFVEYYGPDDPWQLENGFRTGNPPANSDQLHSRLENARDCVGTACP